MALLNRENLDNANTVFKSSISEIFAQKPPGVWQLLTEVIPSTGKKVELDLIGPWPAVVEWVGEKEHSDLRAYTQSITVTKYSQGIEIDRFDVEYDQTGAVAKRLADFAASASEMYDKLAYDALAANGTGYDGSALLANSHAHGAMDNLEAAAVSFTLYDTAQAKMREFAKENSEPYGMNPTHLFVGPDLLREAKEITGATAPVAISTSGGTHVTSGAVTAIPVGNAFAGDVTVVVWPRETGATDWWLCDLSKPGMRPLVCVENRKPTAVSITDPDSLPRYSSDRLLFSVEADLKFASGLWQTIIGTDT